MPTDTTFPHLHATPVAQREAIPCTMGCVARATVRLAWGGLGDLLLCMNCATVLRTELDDLVPALRR